ncbi:hypothetical protein FKW77_001894 [Venturia effusa]|uniref:Uncharacterized protein n=1 Tax=Venturia effusa TaxID=50376 RepID=A0A517L2R6_9PEZI|nr:hypothetical protein FKW77_001894 [Venturia effusa]
MAVQIPTNLFTLPQHLRTIVMFNLIDFTATDKFIDKIAREQADPSLKNNNKLYQSTFSYDLAMSSEWDVLRDDHIQQLETYTHVLSDLASQLSNDERLQWTDDIIYVLGEWEKANLRRREEYKRACRIQPAKKETTPIATQEATKVSK